MTYEMVKQNYDRGLWTIAMLRMVVRRGIITPEQFLAITGQQI